MHIHLVQLFLETTDLGNMLCPATDLTLERQITFIYIINRKHGVCFSFHWHDSLYRVSRLLPDCRTAE